LKLIRMICQSVNVPACITEYIRELRSHTSK
jgi:hypothetical protein